MKDKPEVISIDGTDYVRADTCKPVTGNRRIIVLDRGWIMVGNLTIVDGVSRLSNCYNLRRWTKGGFGGVTKSRQNSGAELDKCADVEFVTGSEIMSVPISEDW